MSGKNKRTGTENGLNKTNKNHTQQYMKQKPLLPTLKERQRYLVYQILFKNKTITQKDKDFFEQNFKIINDDIIKQCSSLLGIFDGASAGIMNVKFNNQKSRGIIKVNNKYVDKLKVCLGLIKTIKIDNSQPVVTDVAIDTIYVSGVLNKAEEKLV